jgi:hypothetical protein
MVSVFFTATKGLGEGVACSTALSAVTDDAKLLFDGPPAAICDAGIATLLRPMAVNARAIMLR